MKRILKFRFEALLEKDMSQNMGYLVIPNNFRIKHGDVPRLHPKREKTVTFFTLADLTVQYNLLQYCFSMPANFQLIVSLATIIVSFWFTVCKAQCATGWTNFQIAISLIKVTYGTISAILNVQKWNHQLFFAWRMLNRIHLLLDT